MALSQPPQNAQCQHGNPEDLGAYLARMESPDRAEWQKPDEVIRALGGLRGKTVCDVGAGPGFLALPFAKAVGEAGTVYAVEVESRILEVLRDRIAHGGVRNIVPVLGLPDDPLLPADSCDLILMVNTFHHFQDGTGYLRRLAHALKEGGKLVNIDFHKKETPVGPPIENRVSRDDFLEHAREAGYVLVGEPTALPHQYFLVLQRKR